MHSHSRSAVVQRGHGWSAVRNICFIISFHTPNNATGRCGLLLHRCLRKSEQRVDMRHRRKDTSPLDAIRKELFAAVSGDVLSSLVNKSVWFCTARMGVLCTKSIWRIYGYIYCGLPSVGVFTRMCMRMSISSLVEEEDMSLQEKIGASRGCTDLLCVGHFTFLRTSDVVIITYGHFVYIFSCPYMWYRDSYRSVCGEYVRIR